MAKPKKKLTKNELYKAMKGTKSPAHATKVIPNKKKHNAKPGIVVQFDNSDIGIGE